MNRRTKEFETAVVSLFVDNHSTINSICTQLSCSAQTVKDVLINHNVDSYMISDSRFNEILKYYRETKSIPKTLDKFNKKPNCIYKVFEHENVLIDDQTILDIFIGTLTKNGRVFPFLIKSRILSFLKNTNNKFMVGVVDYLNNRYSDSTSIQETISRIYNKLEIRPTCKQCDGKVRFQKLTFPFAMFCSRKCANNNEETKQRLIETCLKKYGTTNTAKAECVKQKYRDRMEKKYGKGIVNAFQAKSVIAKAEETKLRKYGNAKFNNSQKTSETCLKRYGVSNTSQVAEFRHKQQFRYTYNSITFDSKPEIAFYIWLKEVKDILNIDFEYSPDKVYEYTFDNKKYYYMPDFRIGDQYFEIKGDHFFKDGKMINPFRYKYWTDEYYQRVCDRYEEKHQCMISNGIIILKNFEYNFFLNYVSEKYGVNYLDQFKNEKILEDLPKEFFGYTQEQILDICLKTKFPGTEKWEADHPIWDCNVYKKMTPKQAWSDINMLKSAIRNLFKILHKSINVGPKFYPKFAASIEKAFNCGDIEICRCVLNRFTVAKIAPKVTALKPDIFEKIIQESGVDISSGVYCPMAGFGGIIQGAKRWFKKHNLIENIEAYDINDIFCDYYGWSQRDALAQVITTDKIVIACPPFGEKTERWTGTPDNMYYDFHEWCKLLKQHIIAPNYIFIGPEIHNNRPKYETGVERPLLFRNKIGIKLYKEYLNNN
jgi:hypothetical protein